MFLEKKYVIMKKNWCPNSCFHLTVYLMAKAGSLRVMHGVTAGLISC